MASKGSSGTPLMTVVLIVFVILKLTDNVQWDWVWVLSPFWIPALAAVCIFAVWAPIWIVKAARGRRQRNERLRTWETR